MTLECEPRLVRLIVDYLYRPEYVTSQGGSTADHAVPSDVREPVSSVVKNIVYFEGLAPAKDAPYPRYT